MFFIGILFLVNVTIYNVFSIPYNTNWEIFYYVTQDTLVCSYFFQSSLTTKIVVYKNYNYLVVWFFVYDIISQLRCINIPYYIYRQKHIKAEELVLLLAAGLIVATIYKIRNKNN